MAAKKKPSKPAKKTKPRLNAHIKSIKEGVVTKLDNAVPHQISDITLYQNNAVVADLVDPSEPLTVYGKTSPALDGAIISIVLSTNTHNWNYTADPSVFENFQWELTIPAADLDDENGEDYVLVASRVAPRLSIASIDFSITP